MSFNFGPETNCPELLCEFFQSFHANAGMIPQDRFLEAQHTLAKEFHFKERCAGMQIGKVMQIHPINCHKGTKRK
jgi:hypothetical protein